MIDDTDLTEDERDELLRTLSMELEAARERLNHALSQRSSSSLASRRHEPEGGREERMAMAGNRRHQQSAQASNQPISGPAISPDGSGSQRDVSSILQEYSDILVNLMLQKMPSSTPGK